MDSIFKCSQMDLVPENTLILLDDELGGISLALKSKRDNFNKITFKFKKLQINNEFFGVLLLKLDKEIYSCFINLTKLADESCLAKLMASDFINLIIFGNSKEYKVYKIQNELKNKILFYFPDNTQNIKKDRISINELRKKFSNNVLWNI